MNPDLLQINAVFSRSLAEAAYHIEYGDEVEEVSMWMQSWPSTACGHGGVGGQAFTTGVVVAVLTAKGEALFFSQGRLLHKRTHDRASAWAIYNRHIPGKGGKWTWPDP